jgi:bifunctional non-homologous end joining protein LigD
MALEEYKRKRDFQRTPEPVPKVEKSGKKRFVVQKHKASHLHFDFRLEMEGVLKSWAIPKGPSLDPADKRLAMHVEDHPVSYFHFEGTIPEGNYGAGTVMVWDTGTWDPLLFSEGKIGTEKDAVAMLEKGDLKFRLNGKKLKGDFVVVKTRSRRPGSKGNEWLLIKKADKYAQSPYDANSDELDQSVLTKRSLAKIAEDKKSKQWQSSRPASTKKKWLADALNKKRSANPPATARTKTAAAQDNNQSPRLASVKGAEKAPMPRMLRPMLATLTDQPFESKDWVYEIKFDGYRALAFIDKGDLRLVSRNQNDMTDDFPELSGLPRRVQAKQAIIDGEICVLDEEGRPSFSLMQQRTGFEPGRPKRRTAVGDMPLVYYAFDIVYLDGYSLIRVDLEKRKELLQSILRPDEVFRYSEHFSGMGMQLYEAAKQKGLEGILAKKRNSCYVQKRSSDWLKIKITQRQECVIGGYTDPRGSREHFGSIVLGLYDKEKRLIPVGQAGSGFNHKTHEEMWKRLKKLETDKSPFAVKPDSTRGLHYVKPELVAEIKFTEWTHEGQKGGLKMRAPVFLGLRLDKKPEECVFELPAKQRPA